MKLIVLRAAPHTLISHTREHLSWRGVPCVLHAHHTRLPHVLRSRTILHLCVDVIWFAGYTRRFLYTKVSALGADKQLTSVHPAALLLRAVPLSAPAAGAGAGARTARTARSLPRAPSGRGPGRSASGRGVGGARRSGCIANCENKQSVTISQCL